MKIHKDENKSLYIQTFIFVLMNFSLYINDLHGIYLYRTLIRLTFEWRNSSEKDALQDLLDNIWIRKYQNIYVYSPRVNHQKSALRNEFLIDYGRYNGV
jgi:hypothetical protein